MATIPTIVLQLTQTINKKERHGKKIFRPTDFFLHWGGKMEWNEIDRVKEQREKDWTVMEIKMHQLVMFLTRICFYYPRAIFNYNHVSHRF